MAEKERDTEKINEEFQKFEDLAEAMQKFEDLSELERSSFLKICPFRKEKCIQNDCSWYIICLNLNSKAFREFFLK